LGFFDTAHALWLQVLLILAAYQGLVATAEGCTQAWQWMHRGEGPPSQPPPARAWEQRTMVLPTALDRSVMELHSAFRQLGYRVRVAQGEEGALLEVMRHRWLTLGRPLAHAGVVLACVAGLLGGRLDWQEGSVTLSPGQSYELHHVPGMILRLEKTGLARRSSQPYSWVSLLRGEQMWCRGVIFPSHALSCGGVRIQQAGTEPALRIAGHDRAGHALAIQPLRGEEAAASEVVLYLPYYVPDRYAVVPERGLMLHIEVSSDQTRPLFRLEVYRGQQSAPLLQRDITDPASLALDDVTLSLNPTRVPSFRVYHNPCRPLRWAGLSLALAGLLVSLALAPFHLWAHIEEQEDGVSLRLWQGLPLLFRVPTIPEIESRMDSLSAAGTMP